MAFAIYFCPTECLTGFIQEHLQETRQEDHIPSCIKHAQVKRVNYQILMLVHLHDCFWNEQYISISFREEQVEGGGEGGEEGGAPG